MDRLFFSRGNFAKINKYLPTVENLNNFSTSRVNYYGAQYVLFGVFAVLIYIVPYYMWSYNDFKYYNLILILRIIAGILYFGLIIKDYWPEKSYKYLPLYWHITLFYSLSFLTTFMVLDANGSTVWLFNLVLSLFLLSVLVDWLSFIIILSVGIISAYGLFYLISGHIRININNDALFLIMYTYAFSIIINVLFSRNKDLIQQQIVHITQMINSELEQKVADRTHHLEKALTAKTDFLNNISHEVRTPIQGVTAISSGLIENWKELSDEKKYQLSAQIATNATRLFVLVNDLLNLSRLNAGKVQLTKKKVSLSDITKIILDEMRPLYESQNSLNVIFEPKDDIRYSCWCDQDKISQVIRNLLANAIKFAEGTSIIIKIKLKQKDIEWSITDYGIGIPKDELDLIFEPFSQSSRTNNGAGGSGLGLSISKEIILAHGGKIWAESKKNRGSVFKFVLPIK
jgi:signal transduction histidine kinase